MESLASAEQLHDSDKHAYHIAPKSAVNKIVDQGIRPDIPPSSDWKSVNDFVTRVSHADPECASLPIDRNHAVYMFEQRKTPLSFIREHPDYVIFTVDFRKLDTNTFYVADMEPITELVREEERRNGFLDQVPLPPVNEELPNHHEGALKLAQRHIQSVTRASTPEDPPPIKEYDVEWITREVVQPAAITQKLSL